MKRESHDIALFSSFFALIIGAAAWWTGRLQYALEWIERSTR